MQNFEICTYKELKNKELPKFEYIIDVLIPKGGISMMYGDPGVGKTFFALSIACAVASGKQLLRWNVEEPRKVLYIDGEMAPTILKDRLKDLVVNYDEQLVDENLSFLSANLQREPFIDFGDKEARDKLDEVVKNFDLIIFDNLSTLFDVEDDKADAWHPIQKWFLKLRSEGKSVLLVHHTTKGGLQRGTVKKEVIMDTIIKLEKPEEMSEDGAAFNVVFNKARNETGDKVGRFGVALQYNPKNNLDWTEVRIVEAEKKPKKGRGKNK